MTLLTTSQYKLNLSQRIGILTAGINLSPAREVNSVLATSHPTACSHARSCVLGCLAKTGMNTFPTHILARANRTDAWWTDREAFMDGAAREMESVVRKGERLGMSVALRPNLLSDLPEIAFGMIARLRDDIKIYDYTKQPRPWIRSSDRYHLTFSGNETTRQHEVSELLDHGINVAVVVDTPKGEPIPASISFRGVTRPTIDGDLHDCRFTDPTNHFVALRWKGSKARLDDALKSGFAVRVN